MRFGALLYSKIFRKKHKQVSNSLVVLIISVYYTTDVYRQPLTLVIFPLLQVPFYVLRRLL